MKIGIFGGTFDPLHVGHLIAAQDACAALSLDRLLFIPAAQPPHKPNARIAPAEVRRKMLESALSGSSLFEVCPIELERTGPSYTVDTLRELKLLFPNAELFLLLGVDQVRDFPTWHEPQQILRLAHVVMLTRAGADAPLADFVHGVVQVTRVDISSTLVRERIATGQPFRYLVPEGVAEVIEREQLYREFATVPDRRS